MKKNFIMLFSVLFSFPVLSQYPSHDAPRELSTSTERIQKDAQVKNRDTILSDKVQKALNQDPVLKGQTVNAGCHEGNITLQGSVESIDQEEKAIGTVKTVTGVKSVDSQLTIKSLP